MQNRASSEFGRQEAAVVRNVREQMRRIAGREVDITAQDVKFLLYCQAVGHGSVELTIVHGHPGTAVRTQERIDFSKEITFEE